MNEPRPTRDDRETVPHGATDAGADAWPTIAGYEILGVLGRGGMGVVYLARQVSLNRLVAVKMILAGEHAGPTQRERFLAEAEALARLHHPGIVQIHEIGQAGGQPYFALEYLPGGTLAQRIAGAPQPPREAAALVEGLARAIHAAHLQGVVHRDLKPANVLFAEDTTAKIADFGLAKLLDDEASPTRTGTVLGTASYMAPEQASGHGKQVGPATDVYALGAILYEMLTGRPPFRAAAMVETLRQVVAEEAVPARRLNPAVPRDLDTICAKCLRKPAGQRYASAAELADDLGRYLRGEPIRARPVGAAERLVKWVRRNPIVTGLLVALVLFAVAAGVLAVLAVRSATNEALARQDAETNADRAIDRLYAADLNLTQRAWQERQYGWARELLEGQLPERTGGRDLRRFEWYYWHRCLHLPRWTVRGADAMSRVAFSPDGTRAAVGYEQVAGPVKLYDLATGKEDAALPDFPDPKDTVVSLCYSADGRRLAVGTTSGKVHVYDLAERCLVATLPVRVRTVWGIRFAAEDRYLVTTAVLPDGPGSIWEVATGREVARLKGPRRLLFFDVSADGTRIVGGNGAEPVRIWDARTGEEQLSFPAAVSLGWLAFSPDGKRVAMLGTAPGQRGAVLAFADAATGRPRGSRRFDLDFDPVSLAYGADGSRLIVAGLFGARILDGQTGEELLVLRGHDIRVVGAALSPDGRRAVTHSEDPEKTLLGWDVTRGAEYRLLRGHTAQVECVAASPDGRHFASGGPDRTLRLWDAVTGHAGRVLPAGGAVRGARYTVDGSRLVAFCGVKAAQQIRAYEVATGEVVASWPIPLRHGVGLLVPTLACGPDGTVAHNEQGPKPGEPEPIRLRSAAGELLGTLAPPEAFVRHLAFSPDGRWLVSCGETAAFLWDVADRSLRFTLRGHRGEVLCAAFRSDGRRLVTGGNDGTARVWDVATGQEVLTLRGHQATLAGVAFTGDGDRIVTAAGLGGNAWLPDQTVRVWEAGSGRELLRLPCREGGCLDLAVSPDGQRVVAATLNSYSLRAWDAPR